MVLSFGTYPNVITYLCVHWVVGIGTYPNVITYLCVHCIVGIGTYPNVITYFCVHWVVGIGTYPNVITYFFVLWVVGFQPLCPYITSFMPVRIHSSWVADLFIFQWQKLHKKLRLNVHTLLAASSTAWAGFKTRKEGTPSKTGPSWSTGWTTTLPGCWSFLYLKRRRTGPSPKTWPRSLTASSLPIWQTFVLVPKTWPECSDDIVSVFVEWIINVKKFSIVRSKLYNNPCTHLLL